MKKTFTLLSVVIGFSISSFAQLSYGLKIGITQSTIKETIFGNESDMDYKTGFQAGIFLDFPLSTNLNLLPAVQFTQKGYKSREGDPQESFYWARNWSLSYLEFPIDLIYHYPVSATTKIFAGAGPVIGIGLYGNGDAAVKTTDATTGQVYEGKFTDSHPFKENGFRRFDLGADLLAGVQVKNFVFTASYNHGLINILNYEQDRQSKMNRSFCLSGGYFLTHRRKSVSK